LRFKGINNLKALGEKTRIKTCTCSSLDDQIAFLYVLEPFDAMRSDPIVDLPLEAATIIFIAKTSIVPRPGPLLDAFYLEFDEAYKSLTKCLPFP
jgi:hypothetical protein